MSSKINVAMSLCADKDENLLVLKKEGRYQEEKKRYERNPWEVPGGKMEKNPENLSREGVVDEAYRELLEETGFEDASLKSSKPEKSYTVKQSDQTIKFYPNLFVLDSKTPKPELGSEHTDYSWISPEDAEKRLEDTELKAIKLFDL